MLERGELLGSSETFASDALADALDVGLFAVDAQLVVTVWNDWLARMTGKPSDEVIGRSLLEVQPDLRPSARAAIERAVAGATVVLSQGLHGHLLDIPAPPGYPGFERMQQSARILPVHASDGSARGAVAIIQDVTERVALEDELRAALAVAQEASRAKSQFLASMSHELRTPIGAMSGYADLLIDGIYGEINAVQRAQLARIKAIGGHLIGIVEQILAFARLEAGRETTTDATIDAAQLVAEAIATVQPLAEKKGLALVVDCPSEPIALVTDAVKVRQILINLLANAVKFTDAGTISVTLVTRGEDMVAFEVADTGPGISVVDQGRFFQPFVQGESHSVRGGTGLGLALSRELARLLGGDLTVTSEVGTGSVFTTTLPRSRQELSRDAEKSQER